MTGQPEIRLDPVSQTVTRGEKSVALPHLSYLLLDLLLDHRPNPVSFAKIEESVWGAQATRETIKQRISLLRKSLVDVGLDEQAIVSVPSIGYRLALAEPAVSDAATQKTRPQSRIALLTALSGALLLALFALLRPTPAADTISRIVVVNEASDVSGPGRRAWADHNRILSSKLAELQGVVTIATISRTDIAATRSRDLADEIGSDLFISSALIGSQDDPRISYQLIDGRSEEILWSGEYDANGEAAERASAHVLKNVNDALLVKGKSLGRDTPGRTARLYYEALEAMRVPEEYSLNVAIARLDEALAMEPDFPLALALRGRAKAELVIRFGAGSALALEALDDSRRAKAMAPDIAEIDYALARSHWAAGDKVAALDVMTRAAQYLPYLDREIAALRTSIEEG